MRKTPNKIEFRFYGAGGSATGPIAIVVFAILCSLALAAIVVIVMKTSPAAFAFTWMARIRGP